MDHVAQTQMTPLQYRESLYDLMKIIGPKAECYTSLNENGPLFHVALYANGITSRNTDGYLRVEADTFSDLLTKVKAAWSDYETRHRSTMIRKMALAIIRITADLGQCTDAALRNCGEFDLMEVKRYGELACVEANELAGKGPFHIVSIGAANSEAA